MSEVQRAARMWSELKTIRATMLREFHLQVKIARENLMQEFVAEVQRLLRAGVKKSTIAAHTGASRSTIDRLLAEYKISAKTYTFERAFGYNVRLVGVLTDTGGFPTLEGEQSIRFRIHDGIATADDAPNGVREFLNATYGAEAHAYAVENKVPGWDQVAKSEVDTGEDIW